MATTTYSDLTGPVVKASWLNNVDQAINGSGPTQGAALVPYKAPSVGASQRTVQAKLQESQSVIDFGADPTGVTDSAPAFTAAYAAVKDVNIPAGTYLLNSNPTFTTSVSYLGKGTAFTGAGALSMLADGSPGYQVIQQSTAGTDFAGCIYARRQAIHTGGTPGFTSACIRADTYVTSTTATNYEWTAIFTMKNYATAGQNLALFAQGNKMVTNSGPVWGSVIEAQEQVSINNPTSGLLGMEIDNRSNGPDSSGNRIGIDLVCGRFNATNYNISGITVAVSAVVTLNTVSASNPFLVGNLIFISGVSGMTQINNLTGTVTAIGGVSGAWTVTTNINSSGFGAWTSGGTAGVATLCSWGYRIQTNNDLAAQVGTGFGFAAASNVTATVGFDTSGATILQAAYKMAQGQVIAFDAAATNQLKFDGTGLVYSSGGTNAVRLNSTGEIDFGSGGTMPVRISGSTSGASATPTLTANKPGANNGVTTWLSITIAGTQCWIPCFGN